jgi:hypothetical protein
MKTFFKQIFIAFSLCCLLLLVLLSSSAWASDPSLAVKNFRSFYYSLSVVTGVRTTPEIMAYYASAMTRLPKDGRLDEILNPSAFMAIKGLASMFCKEYAAQRPAQPPASSDPSDQEILNALSLKIYGRSLTAQENKILLELMVGSEDKVFIACTAMTSSFDFLVQ